MKIREKSRFYLNSSEKKKSALGKIDDEDTNQNSILQNNLDYKHKDRSYTKINYKKD
jgi:hypothetical protein